LDFFSHHKSLDILLRWKIKKKMNIYIFIQRNDKVNCGCPWRIYNGLFCWFPFQFFQVLNHAVSNVWLDCELRNVLWSIHRKYYPKGKTWMKGAFNKKQPVWSSLLCHSHTQKKHIIMMFAFCLSKSSKNDIFFHFF
jgi:hypothetical protein